MDIGNIIFITSAAHIVATDIIIFSYNVICQITTTRDFHEVIVDEGEAR